MILFPTCKINLGLAIERRRPDGYHDISTVMCAVDWTDILEIVPARGPQTSLTLSGNPVECPPEKNLVMKAWRALDAHVGGIAPVDMFLHKIIPDGAGLGGGSADAAFALKGINEVLSLGLKQRELAEVASKIGADCPFFIYNEPAFCTGTGTTMTHGLDLGHLRDLTVVIAKPQSASVSTAEAYAGARVAPAKCNFKDVVTSDPKLWPGKLYNDFEQSIIPRVPHVATIKSIMHTSGALYEQMSGSGSAVFGIFDDVNLAQKAARAIPEAALHIGKLCL